VFGSLQFHGIIDRKDTAIISQRNLVAHRLEAFRQERHPEQEGGSDGGGGQKASATLAPGANRRRAQPFQFIQRAFHGFLG
jgi:hypothetical protein